MTRLSQAARVRCQSCDWRGYRTYFTECEHDTACSCAHLSVVANPCPRCGSRLLGEYPRYAREEVTRRK